MSIIDEMKRVVNSIVGNPKQADDIVFELIKNFGGERMHMPSNDYQRRNKEIIELHEAGASVEHLAARYRLSERTIYRIISH
jgi:Mor family transcriptional regulator